MVGVETVHAGTLEGTIYSQSSQPPPKVLAVTKDQDHCGAEVNIQTVHLHGPQGVLSEAVVNVQGINAPLETGAVQRPVINMHCAFAPRISTAQQGQEIEVHNQDPILHNTHIKLAKRTFLNVAQVPSGKPIIKRLNRHGLHVIRCDKHVFMEAYLHVFSHPFYALTDATGKFRITGIPAGDHPIRVWHETLGVLNKMVTIPSNGTVTLNFAYP